MEPGASGRRAEGPRVRTEAFPLALFTEVTLMRRAAGPYYRGQVGMQGKDTGHQALLTLIPLDAPRSTSHRLMLHVREPSEAVPCPLSSISKMRAIKLKTPKNMSFSGAVGPGVQPMQPIPEPAHCPPTTPLFLGPTSSQSLSPQTQVPSSPLFPR